MIVDGKLKEGKCLVECEDNMYLHEGSGKYWEDEPVWMKKYLDRQEKYIKLNPHITIYHSTALADVEEKMYTREEVQNILIEYVKTNPTKPYHPTKWFEQNVK